MRSIKRWLSVRLYRRMVLVILTTVLILAAGTVAFITGHDKIGDPFLGVFYGENLTVSASQRASWPGVVAGIRPGDRILTVNQLPFERGAALSKYLWKLPYQSMLNIEVRRAGETKAFHFPMPRLNLNDFLVVFVAPCSLGVLFLIMGVVLFFTRPRYQASLVYFIFCAATSLTSMIHFELFSAFEFFRLSHFHALIIASALHLFTLFPQRRRDGWHHLPKIAYPIAGLLLIGLQWSYFKPSFAFFNRLDIGFLAVGMLTLIVLLVQQYRSPASAVNEDKAKVLLLGAAIGFPLILTWAVGYLFYQKIYYLDQAVFLFLLFPIFLGYATLRRNIFDIDRVIRVGISYGLLGGAIFAAYITMLSLVGDLIPDVSARQSPMLFVIVILLGAVIVAQGFNGVQNYLMRNVFKGRYQLIRTLQEFTDRLSRAKVVGETEEILVDRLPERLALSGAAFLRFDNSGPDGRYRVERHQQMDPHALEVLPWREVLPLLPPESLVVELETLKELPGWQLIWTKTLSHNQVHLLLVIPWPVEHPSLLLMGQRLGDKELTRETLDLLPTIAKQAALTLENAEYQKSDSERERLAALGKVASIMIHEVKNPLGIIRVSSETILRRLERDPVSKELAEIIVDEISRMDGTIQRFLNFAKPDPLMLEPFEPTEIIREVVLRLRPDFEKSGATLQIAGELPEVKVVGDPDKFRRLMVNLLINAKEATIPSEPNPIEIRLQLPTPRTYLITIQDSGVGMDEATAQKIFQPFFTTKRGSTGLGMSIVQKIVQEHHGEITIQSVMGSGTMIQITLPRGAHESNVVDCR